MIGISSTLFGLGFMAVLACLATCGAVLIKLYCVGLSRHMWRSVGLDKININNFLTFLEISKMSTVVVKKENPTEASSAQLQPSTAAESLPITNILIARCYKIKF